MPRSKDNPKCAWCRTPSTDPIFTIRKDWDNKCHLCRKITHVEIIDGVFCIKKVVS